MYMYFTAPFYTYDVLCSRIKYLKVALSNCCFYETKEDKELVQFAVTENILYMPSQSTTEPNVTRPV